uniref:HEAT repeat-containing protein 4 isoform X3 n=1 Tax=Pristiophorus japonicus TaxID=55135 RepID=UPI00398E7237
MIDKGAKSPRSSHLVRRTAMNSLNVGFLVKNSLCPVAAEFPTAPLKLPRVGATASSQNWKAVFPLKEVILPHLKYRQLLRQEYIKNAALNVNFSQDVVDSMTFYQVPFKERDSSKVFDLFGLDAPPEVKGHPPSKPGRSDRVPQRCCSVHLKPMRVEDGQRGALTPSDHDRSASIGRWHKPPLPVHVPTAAAPSLNSSHPAARAFLTEVARQDHGGPPKRAMAAEDSPGLQRQHELWDEYLVKKLSKRTAQWLVTKQTPKGPSRVRLLRLLQERYGSTRAHALVQDETMTASDFNLYDHIKAHVPSVAVVKKVTETPLATYYRVPGFELSEDFAEEPGAVNRTAANVIVKHLEPPPKPKTIINSKLGKHVYYTENAFEQELYTGSSRVVHYHGEKYKERIIMDDFSEYQKHLQERFPQSPEEWSVDKEDKGKRQAPQGSARASRGLRRWTALPTLADYTMEQGLRLPDYEQVEKPVKKTFKTREALQVMRNMVTEWVKAGHVYSHWKDVTVEELKKDLKTIHSHVQLNALATCASGAIERPKLEEDKGTEDDRWIAAQSLALNGDDSYPVINKIIQHLFEAPEAENVKQVCLVLRPLSERTPLAHFILAKHLNSRNWKDKVLACNVLSCLRGSLNKDLTHKIVYLMWNDWNINVRQAATHSLGALGLGKEVHDELRVRLEKGDSRIRIVALSCIGQLGVMTGQLMPSFLECFTDDVIGVRREACLTAGLLRIKDEKVLDHLVRLVQTDPVWKIKAYAIKALGDIGQVTEELKNLLLWALHYEQEPGIRMEACNSIVSLKLRDVHVQTVLREQLLVEPDPLIQQDVKAALQMLAGSSEVEEGMLQKIKQQVHALCQKDVVIWKLLRLEKVNLNVSQQLEWINLQTQPEHLKVLTEQLEQLNKNLTAPNLPSMHINDEGLKECEAEIQSIVDSSSPAGTQTAEQRESARCSRNGEWQTISGGELQYSRALRTGQRPRQTTHPSQLQEETENKEESLLDFQMESKV